MQSALSFEQAPPISVPVRFMTTAPWFGVAAGVLLLWWGPDALASRWAPPTLALTHLLTVGFMLQAMCGALLQFIPVAIGGNVWRPRLVAATVHPALVVGALLLVGGFASWRPELLRAAAWLLVAALGFYTATIGVALIRASVRNATIAALRAAIIGLLVTVVLGVVLVQGLVGSVQVPIIGLVDVHAAWGLGGWALLLLVGVSLYVVPMFQLTPPYPQWIGKLLPPTMLAVLGLFAVLQLAGHESVAQAAAVSAGIVVAATFAGTTLWLQHRRRRKVTDPTFWFFRGAMLSLVAVSLLWAIVVAGQDLLPLAMVSIWIGALAIGGVFVSAINGMLYKIVPFLIWLHLQREGGGRVLPPNMQMIIPEAAMRRQMALHFAALALLLLGPLLPAASHLAGAVFAASNAWLGWNLVTGVRAYSAARARIRASAAGRES